MTHVGIIFDEQKFQVFNVVIRNRRHPLAQSGDIISNPIGRVSSNPSDLGCEY